MMNTPWYYAAMEHKGICVSFFTYGISLKYISIIVVGDMKLVFVDTLESNGLFIYGHVLISNT